MMGNVRARSVTGSPAASDRGLEADEQKKLLLDGHSPVGSAHHPSPLGHSKLAGLPYSAAAAAAGARLRAGGWRRLALLTVLVLGGWALLSSGWGEAVDVSEANFVRVVGTQFEHQCRPFLVSGFNVDIVGQAPITALARRMGSVGFNGRRLVRTLLRQAGGAGLNVMRTFAHTTDPNFPLQVRPGQYSEDAFKALDFVVAEAGKAGMKVVLSLVDNWKYAGGVDEFVDWSATVPARDPKYPPINKLGDVTVEEYSPDRRAYEDARKPYFFSDPACRDMYRNHITAVVLRRNVYTGLQYKDDPTIAGWNLINEPRCSAYTNPECPKLLAQWVDEMAGHIKSMDSRHLITVGSEGFWGEADPLRAMNPGAAVGSDWASKTGQDFAADHGSRHIDFTTVHMWPDNWSIHNHSFHRAWLEKHIEESGAVLKKPILIEEFGKVLGRGHNPPPTAIKKHRDPVFENVYGVVERAFIRGGNALVGSMYWRWGFNVYDSDLPGPYGVLPEHSTFGIVAQHAKRVRAAMNAAAPRPDCQLECWVPTTSAFGLLRRCENKPSVCSERAAHPPALTAAPAGNASDPAVAAPRLHVVAAAVYATQRDCCRPGLGAFEGGCTTAWL